MTSSSSYTAATAPARRPSCCLGCSQWHATASSISIAQSAAVAIGAGNDERPVDLCVALGRLMGPLSEQDQHALRAVELQGMSQKEYADSLGLNYTTAKSRIQRARKPLLYCPRVLGQWFDGIRFYAAASSPRRLRRTWAGLR